MSMYAINDTAIDDTAIDDTTFDRATATTATTATPATAASEPAAGPPRHRLYLLGPPAPSRRLASPAVFLRRRLAAALLATAVVLVVAMAVAGASGDRPSQARGEPHAPATRVAPTSAAVEEETYVVRRGDTLWAIARALQPDGDVRPVVDRLAAQRGGRPLQVGERVSLP